MYEVVFRILCSLYVILSVAVIHSLDRDLLSKGFQQAAGSFLVVVTVWKEDSSLHTGGVHRLL